MIATTTKAVKGKCQPEGWLPPTGRVGGVSAGRADGYPTERSMPAVRAEGYPTERSMPAVRADGYPTERSMPAARADDFPTGRSMLAGRADEFLTEGVDAGRQANADSGSMPAGRVDDFPTRGSLLAERPMLTKGRCRPEGPRIFRPRSMLAGMANDVPTGRSITGGFRNARKSRKSTVGTPKGAGNSEEHRNEEQSEG
jgi:hypothetical protein